MMLFLDKNIMKKYLIAQNVKTIFKSIKTINLLSTVIVFFVESVENNMAMIKNVMIIDIYNF
jgi:hypothetical protein